MPVHSVFYAARVQLTSSSFIRCILRRGSLCCWIKWSAFHSEYLCLCLNMFPASPTLSNVAFSFSWNLKLFFFNLHTVKFILWCTVLWGFLFLLFFFFFLAPCSIWDLSSLTSNWTHSSLHWKHRVLTTGLPGKSLCEFWQMRRVMQPP